MASKIALALLLAHNSNLQGAINTEMFDCSSYPCMAAWTFRWRRQTKMIWPGPQPPPPP
uniref:Uncharacterized protein n=1 Tax=Setaria viridis TaxID=4556 RepID=A0A4U6T2K9_SETVI|nr:hypothetical protein SEVIR_9G272250v2 [Setaria viridis]